MSGARELTYLCRELKHPALLAGVERLAERARADAWSHEEFLAACLEREVSARQSHGGDARIRSARFPARKTLEDFDFDHQRSVRKEVVAHLGALDFIEAKSNAVFLGPPGTGKSHLSIALGIRACLAGHRVAFATEINAACDDARRRGLKQLGAGHQRAFAARYDRIVADGLAANPDPARGRKQGYYQRRSFNLVSAFAAHGQPILRYMYDLDVSFSNNQAERDLRPVKIHRKVSSCFRSTAGAERFAHVRSYLSTTRKHDVGALDALTRLFNGDPWMPSQAA